MPTSPTKSLGAGVSGYLPPDKRAFETLVYQQNKPILEKEFNLAQDLALSGVGGVQTILKKVTPTGWLSTDFLSASAPTPAWFVASTVSNQLKMTAPLHAYVNGWLLEVEYTNLDLTAAPSTTGNFLDMGSPPTGAGAKRTDIVILECWRQLLSAAPDVVGKSTGGLIFRNGNVKIPAGSDVALNYADDLKDATVAAETTKRVQIQYRLRVISNVDLFAYPYGIDDPSVTARSAPPNVATPDGSSSAFAFTNQSPNGDPGLWRAGDGIPTNGLGTVDGYIYATPFCAVFRRNSTAFARNTNHNGGGTSPGSTTNPAGLYNNIIDQGDIVDLRYGVALEGWNFQEVLERNFNALLDNSLATDWGTTSVGGGVNGHTVLFADEVGVSTANGGSLPDSGDTAGGQFIGEFDNVRRRFSDRATYETMTVRVPASGSWTTGSTVTIDLTNVAVYPYSAFNFAAYAPAKTMVVDVTRARYVGDGTTTLKNLAAPITDISGLATAPPAALTLKLGTIPGGVTTEDLLVDLLIAYPPGVGLTKTPTTDTGFTGSFSLNNPAALPVGAPVLWSTVVTTGIDAPHREALIQYRTLSRTFDMATDSAGATNQVILPERAFSVSAVSVDSVPLVGSFTVDTTGRILTLPSVATPGHKLTITYIALRPIPQTGAQYTIYYQTRQPQTARTSLLGTSLTMVPRFISPFIYVLTAGSGSPDEAYPFPYGYVQTGGIYPTSGGTFSGEHQLDGSGSISVSEFSATTGFLRVPSLIPYTPDPAAVTFNRNDPGDRDAEDRTFFKSVPGGAYIPNAYGQPLSDATRHKAIVPSIMELTVDSPLGRKGQLVLVLLTRWAVFDEKNSVVFNSDLSQNTTTASVYRIKGNLLNRSL